MAERAVPRFRFGVGRHGGPILGLRVGQAAAVAAGALLSVACPLLLAGPVGMGLAAAAVLGSAAVVVLPVAGRGVDEWLPVVVSWLFHRRRRQWRSDAAGRGHVALSGRAGSGIAAPTVRPRVLDGVRLLGVATSAGELGVIDDRRQGLVIAVLRVSGSSFALLAEDDRARALRGWGDLLAARAHRGGTVARIQVLVRTLREDPNAIVRHLEAGNRLPLESPVLRAYLSLLDEAAPAAATQETHIAVAVSRRAAGRAIRQAGGGDHGAAQVLLRELRLVQAQLDATAQMRVVGALTPELVALVFRESWELSDVAHSRSGPIALGSPVTLDSAMPQRTHTHWDHLETDGGACHASYWVSEWPRIPVGTDFLVPLLLQTRARIAWSVVMAPVEPGRARRDIESAQTAHLADEALRERHGFRTSFHTVRERDAIGDRERELADGHAEYRFSGYITVTGDSTAALTEACGEVEQQARNCHLDVRRLDGQHEAGFANTLPLCRGLR